MTETTTFREVCDCFPPRKSDANKGDFGKALLNVGSYGMCGAAILAGSACVKSGAGLVRLALPESIYPMVSPAVPEAVCLPLPEKTPQALSLLLEAARQSSVTLCGCGCGNTAQTQETVLALCREKIRLILDADGINALGGNIDAVRNSEARLILTPHPGEFSRLIGKSVAEIQEDRVRAATEFSARTGAVLLLKGEGTVIAAPDGRVRINPTGNPGMARGGSGDVLSGILAAFAAQGLPDFEAAVCAAYLHGAAGDLAAQRYSTLGMTPTDLIRCLSDLFLKLESER